MRRSLSSDQHISLNAKEPPFRLVKSRSEAVLTPGSSSRSRAQRGSPLNSDDEDEEDEIAEDEDYVDEVHYYFL